MNPASPDRHGAPLEVVWWVIWFGILSGLCLLFVFLRQDRAGGTEGAAILDYIGLLPLLVSSVLRWLVLPKITRGGPALVVFVAGLALAEGCGILGLFLSSRPIELFILGTMGVLQWAPVFAGRFRGHAS